MDPILAVHDPEMVALLRTAFERAAHEAHAGPHVPRVLLPETFAVRRSSARVPHSLWANLGYYCFDTSSPLFAQTWEAVYWAVQCALAAAQTIVQGERAAYALCRPPGHHAAVDLFGGFCYLNNAAIAAHWLTAQGARVAVLDVDYHHGNGTQSIFYDRPDVLTVSLHADPDVDYPYFWGYARERGSGAGEGFNCNLPLPRSTQEGNFLAALAEALNRVRDFAPDCLVLSLGADTHRADPVGGFLLDTESFRRVGGAIGALRLPIVVVQEGGYALDVLGESVVGMLRGLLDG
jgi:acetoin utilization deacetylase AcuC-like enzyme